MARRLANRCTGSKRLRCAVKLKWPASSSSRKAISGAIPRIRATFRSSRRPASRSTSLSSSFRSEWGGPLQADNRLRAKSIEDHQGLPRRKLMLGIRRRKFILFLGGAAAAWPIVAWAQEARHVPIIGYLAPTNPLIPSRSTGAFLQRLRELGWIDGQTIRIESRWAAAR